MTASLPAGSAADIRRRYGDDGVAAVVERMRADTKRLRLVNDCPTALDLACRFDLETVRTPALELLATKLRETVRTSSGRLVVSIGPQEGKTSLLRMLCVWLLADDPERRIVFASFAHSLAADSGLAVRDTITVHGEELGLAIDPSRGQQGDWRLAGHRGGMYAVGTGGALTGRPADLLCVDDPLRNQQDADSELIRRRLHEWWTAVARTRLAPGAPVIVVQTRWAQDDLAGRLISEGWPQVNIPALADGQTLDSLDRPVGEWLVSARGRTREQWEETRAAVGERVFAAMYQGRPAPLEGGLFQRAWFDSHRVVRDEVPELVEIAVGVDPADTGTGDEAGVLVAGRSPEAHLYVLADLTGMLSQAQWARRTCLAWLQQGAAKVVQERTLGMRSSIPDAWSLLRRQAHVLVEHGGDVDAALAALTEAGDDAAANAEQLVETAPWAGDILSRPSTGPRVESVTPRQSKLVRAQSITGLFETGRAHIVGRLPELEHELCFPGGTSITTDRGDVPIETVTTEDRVWTRSGWRRVRWAGMTSVAQCMTVESSDGHVLRATPGHRVWTESDGWKSMQTLAPGHTMVACRSAELGSTSRSTGGIMRSTETDTGRPARSGDVSRGFSTVTCGSTRTGSQSLRATTFTIGTTTSPITSQATSWPSPRRTTSSTTHQTAVSVCGLLSSGRSFSGSPGQTDSRPSESARTHPAGPAFGLQASAPSTALLAAGRRLRESALESSSEPGTTPSSGGASTTVRRVLPPSGPAVPVYDLTVEGEHEFFAAGLLVHNCTWQPGQKSPNRLDTLAHLLTHLDTSRAPTGVSSPSRSGGRGGRVPTRTASDPRRSARRR